MSKEKHLKGILLVTIRQIYREVEEATSVLHPCIQTLAHAKQSELNMIAPVINFSVKKSPEKKTRLQFDQVVSPTVSKYRLGELLEIENVGKQATVYFNSLAAQKIDFLCELTKPINVTL